MSLKEQLLKAGLVNKKQLQQSESNKRKQEHDSKKNKDLAKKLEEEKQNEISLIEEEKRKRQELDKDLNKKRDALIAQRENFYRALQLINSNSLNTREAQEYYFFAENKYVRKVFVTPWQREMLARGKFAIAKPYDETDDYIIIPKNVAKTLQEIYPEKLIVLHPEMDDNDELDFNYT